MGSQLSAPAHLAGLNETLYARRALQQRLATLSAANGMIHGLDASVDRLARSSRAADFAALEEALRRAVAAPADVRCCICSYGQ